MALTLSVTPANIDNKGIFTISTDLSEDTSHVNLRIRADITVDSVIVATSEKPSSLPNFDFYYILKALVPGITHARGSGTNFSSGGSPLVAYTILFTEVWEALGVTTTGETNAPATTFKFVPAQKDVITMSDYVLSGGSSKFANFTLRARAAKYYTAIPYEYWIVFFTEESSISFSISKDGVSAGSVSVSTPDGWGVIQLNAAGLMSGVTSVLAISSSYSETLSIYVDASPITERTVLEFVGIAGGMEYLPFEGIRHHEQASLRNYFSTANKSRKPLLLNGVRRQKLATRYVDIPYAEYLAHLLYSEDVRVLLASYATPSPVTVITDSAVLVESELFLNNIEIEYQ